MADIDFELISPTATQANDAILVRRGAAAPNTGALILTADMLSRANHTGTQAASTITGLASVATSGSASDLGTGTLPAARLSLTKAQLNTAVSDGDVLYVGDVTSNATHTGDATGSTALTLATVNSNVGSFGSATQVATFTVNAKGLTTAAGNTSIAIPMTAISDSTAAGRAVLGAATATAQTALFDVFTSAAKGLAPASGGGTTNFLRADGTWAAPSGGGGGTPGGSTGEVQYNNAGAFAGAADVEIEGGQLRFPSIATPTAPAADGIKLYTKSQVGQRDMLAILYPNGREARLDEDESEFLQLQYRPAPNSGLLVGDGSLPQTITGTATASTVQVTNFFQMFPRIEARVGTASTTAVAGFRGGNAIVRVGKDSNAPGGFNFRCAWGPSAYSLPSTHRACCGLLNTTAAPTDVEPSTQVNGVWMGWDAADTNIQIMHNDGTGAATKIDLGASFPVPTGSDNTTVYLLELYSPNESTQSVEYHVIKYNAASRSPAATASGTITTDLPSVTTLLANRVWVSVGGTSSQVGVALFGVSIDLDYS